MKELTQWLTIVVYAGIVFTLVRPGSQGPKLISTVGDSVSGILKTGTGAGQTW